MQENLALPVVSRRRFVLGASLAVLGTLSVFYVSRDANDYTGPALSVTDAYEKAALGDITLIDIRRPDEWALTGVGEGAHPIDMRQENFTELLDDLIGNKNRPVALICARGVRSARLANNLSASGFTQVIDVPEGMLGSSAGPGWLAADLPVIAFKEPS